jgi:hypothetical protein
MVHEGLQLAGRTVEGLTAPSPFMLGIVILNVVGIGAAIYFLNILITGQQGHLAQVLEVQQTEVRQILEMHNREFDALMVQVKDMLPDQATTAAEFPPLPLPKEKGR